MRRRTATSGRSRSASARTASGSGARSAAGPRRRSGTSSRRPTTSSTAASTSAMYTVRQAVDDGGGRAAGPVGTDEVHLPRGAQAAAGAHRPQAAAGTDGPRRAQGARSAQRQMSTRYLQLARASLARAIRYAEAHDLVGRNVATLVTTPRARSGGRAAPSSWRNPRAAGGGPGVAAERLCRAQPRGRHPYRGGQGTALGSRRPRRRSRRGAAGAAVWRVISTGGR